MVSNQSPYSLKDLFPFNDFNKLKKTCALHFYIAHNQTAKNFAWINKQPLSVLERKDPVYGLTALHLAVMKGDIVMADFLVSKGVSITAVDNRHYTILHHATITRNEEMLAWIVSADKTHQLQPMKMIEGKTAADLEKILSYSPAASNQPVFNYLDSDSGEMVYDADASKFKELTGAHYSDHVLATPKALIRNWQLGEFRELGIPEKAMSAYLVEQYEASQEKLPVLYLAQNPNPHIGYDVHAGEDIEPYQIVTVYASELIETPPENGSYLLVDMDGRQTRNLAPMINDGFPNLASYLIHLNNEAGMSAVFISTRKIQKGERLTFDYGRDHATKWNQHTELNVEHLEHAFRSQSLITQMQERIAMLMLARNNPNDGLIALKSTIQMIPLTYLLNTPSSLFYLLAKEILSTCDLIQLLKMPQAAILGNNVDSSLILVEAFQNAKGKMSNKGLASEFNELILEPLQQKKTKTVIYLLHLICKDGIDDSPWEEQVREVRRTNECIETLCDLVILESPNIDTILKTIARIPSKHLDLLIYKMLSEIKQGSPKTYEAISKRLN